MNKIEISAFIFSGVYYYNVLFFVYKVLFFSYFGICEFDFKYVKNDFYN